MSEILQYVITSLISIIGTGSIGSIFYFRLQKRAKEAEVKSSEIAAQSASNEEWIKLYEKCVEENRELKDMIANTSDKLDAAYKSKDAAWEKYADCRNESNKKDLVISELNWFRCELNGCPYRRPPRKYGEMDFPKDGVNPEENPDPNAL